MAINNWKKNAGFFIGGQFLSMFGSMLVQHSIIWSITLETKSGWVMTLFTCAALLPMVFISLFAGVWADRFNRKILIIISDASIALVTLGLAITYISGYKNIWLMLIIVTVRAFGQGIQQPAVSAVIPQIVPSESLTRFNGVQGTIQSLNMFAAPMVAAALLTLMPLEYIFFIDVVTAVAGISVMLLFVKVPNPPEKEFAGTGLKAYFSEIKEGFSYIGKKPWLKSLLAFSVLFSLLITPAAMLTPLQIARSFGDDVWRLTALEIVFSVGTMTGGIVISAWGGLKNKTHTVALGCAGMGFASLMLGVVPNFLVYLVFMMLCGVCIPICNTPSMALLQTHISPEILGRVMGVYMMLAGFAMPAAMLVFGPVGDIIKIEWLLIATGVVIFLGGFVLLRSKELVKIGGAKAPEISEEGI